jgi:hypothetical protein
MGTPQAARRYDYLLGGKDNFAADRDSGNELKKVFPAIEIAVRENRKFMRRVVHFLASDRGIRQFIDIGVGMPSAPNVHEIAQAVHPTARVVYVDHDPVVAVHARALLTGSRPGVRVFVHGDLRTPGAIVDDPVVQGTLRMDEPIAVLLIAVLPFITDDDLAYAAVRRLTAALPSGSYVALSHATYDDMPPGVSAKLTRMSAADSVHGPFRARSHDRVAGFIDGLTAIEPGLVPIVEWLPDRDPPAEASPAEAVAYGAVAQVP